MSPALPIAIVVDTDVGQLSSATLTLAKAGYQVIARLSPRGLMELIDTLRPDLLLLGVCFWEQGWAPLFRSASPDSVLFPFGEDDPGAGVIGASTLSALLGRSEAPESHAA